jgi:hypothetical protein
MGMSFRLAVQLHKQTRKARRGAQLPCLGAHFLRERDGIAEIALG